MLLDFEQIVKDLGVEITGVIQVGAHFFEEKECLERLGVKSFALFEPQKEAFKAIKEKTSDMSNAMIYNVALADYKGKTKMFIEEVNMGQSSSILEPKEHKNKYPDIEFIKEETVKVDMLDNYDLFKYNFNTLIMDAQGAEMLILKGATETLKSIDIIYTEVNFIEMYKGCALIDEMDAFLKEKGFYRYAMGNDMGGWSDAVYVLNYAMGNDMGGWSDAVYVLNTEPDVFQEPIKEGDFNEEVYLSLHPDIRSAVDGGIVKSGLDHYNRFGRNENRRVN